MDKDNRIQIRQILNIIKISSLVFPAIAFLQYYSKMPEFSISTRHTLLVILLLLIILLVYSAWVLIQSKMRHRTLVKQLIDPAISMSIALLSVLLTGSYQSNYKFLFVFVILFTSIECSRTVSLTVSALAAGIILTMDLVLYRSESVNIYFECDIVLAIVFMIISWMISYYDNIRRKHIAYLRELVNIDGLTQLYNHRYFHDYLTRQVAVGRKTGTPVSLLFIDIDNFKYYNDIYGHQHGDEVLRTIAQLMKQVLPENAFIARYGGEEFAAVFPDTNEKQALLEAEKLRLAVQEYPFDGQESLPGGNLTISLGVSTFPDKAKSDAELIKGADDACYRAKFLCKNRVETYFSILDEMQFGNEIITQIKTLIAVINAKDKYTYRHVERVVFYCNMLADELHLEEDRRRNLIYAAYLHDIGKINIAEEILTKTEPLTAEEWATLKNHPQYAVDIINNNPLFDEIQPIILQHHECFDGHGYPGGLHGEQIDPLARLLTVVDSFDAMTSLRPYQRTRTYAEALDELQRCSGTQFDPEAVTAFTHCIETRNRYHPEPIDTPYACSFGLPSGEP
ncbi:MAG: diguanylate cyclase [Candidatus Limiplasma sp.]|nr:diguanylate cyclase [Candidatus Limiplasma sp.]